MNGLLSRMKYAARWLINQRDRDAVEDGISEIEDLRGKVERMESEQTLRQDDFDDCGLTHGIEVDDEDNY